MTRTAAPSLALVGAGLSVVMLPEAWAQPTETQADEAAAGAPAQADGERGEAGAGDGGAAPREPEADDRDEPGAEESRQKLGISYPPVLYAPATEVEAVADCCKLRVSGGFRGGVSVNQDQWVLGGHIRFRLPCLGGLTLEPVVLPGIGGNWVIVRGALRLSYFFFWPGTAEKLAIYPSAGYGLAFHAPNPLSEFSDFCRRTKLDECWGFGQGFELGGGLQYSWLGLEAVAGRNALPKLTITLTATFPPLGEL